MHLITMHFTILTVRIITVRHLQGSKGQVSEQDLFWSDIIFNILAKEWKSGAPPLYFSPPPPPPPPTHPIVTELE